MAIAGWKLSLQPRGTGFEFVERIKGGTIPRNYIPAIEAGVKEACETGALAGYPIIDIKVTVFDGSYHEVDSNENAFKMAGSIGLKAVVHKAKPIILEPIMKMEVVSPKEFMGDVIGDISSRRAHIELIENRADMVYYLGTDSFVRDVRIYHCFTVADTGQSQSDD